MAEGSSNSTRAAPPAGAMGRIVDAMRGQELSRWLPPPQADNRVEALRNLGAARDWSQLQEDLLIHIFSRLQLPELVYAGAVCLSWRLSFLAVRRFRLCSPNQSPYLVYSSRDRGSNTATLHNLSTNKQHVSPGSPVPQPLCCRILPRLACHLRRTVQPTPPQPHHRCPGVASTGSIHKGCQVVFHQRRRALRPLYGTSGCLRLKSSTWQIRHVTPSTRKYSVIRTIWWRLRGLA